MKLRLQIIMEYEADPADYGTDDPIKMAEIDQENFAYDLGSMFPLLEVREYTVIVDAPDFGFVEED